MERGYNYLILEEKTNHTFKKFSEMISEGGTGLCFTTTYPMKVKKRYRLGDARMIWITEAKPQGDVATVNPKRLQFEMTKTIMEFLDENEDPVILIDGFGYLILENGLDNVRKFIKKVNDKASLTSATVMIPVNPSSFSKEDVNSLARDFDSLEDFTQIPPDEEEPVTSPKKKRSRRSPPKKEGKKGALEDVFLIYNNGLLITHNTRRLIPNIDQEILSGMLTAVQEFVRDSFHHFKESELKGLEFGDHRIMIERGEHVYLAIVYTGELPGAIQERMRRVIAKIEEDYEEGLEDWDGSISSLPNIDETVKLVFTEDEIVLRGKARPEGAAGPPTPTPGAVGGGAPTMVVKHSEWFLRGLQADRAGRYEEALEHYDRAVRELPTDVKAWFNRGVVLQVQGRVEEAIRCYDEAIKIDPKDPEVWSNRGIALRSLGRTAEALTCYDEALRLNPNDASIWSNRGIALRSLGDVAGALECYERALRLNPNDAGVWSNKGVALQSVGRHDEALACYERALQIDPGRRTARKNREILLRQMGRG